ncbi:FkbM family methyltransferase [Pseudomonas sp. OV226]|jgi:FkbM family methyltransferase|uniref:FkbM family methyltransferase n=1 Tax=Pseudomonas sp. OV226 TaxID=2135588 RepID=UPI000D792B50|nr:FkbM family methyltransferase [Pseudomonas sp. OV226]PWK45021.1 FkbM family methyltransferase [Pseudomonas sp. OV226]
MNSIKRNGVDIETAFSIASSRLHTKTNVSSGAISLEDALLTSFSGTKPRLLHRIKQVIRSIARGVFRLIKPITRPLLFRLRNYFTADIRQEMMGELARLNAEQHQHHQHIVQELERLSNATGLQTRLSQKIFSSQLSPEDIEQQLDRIEKYSLVDANRVAIDSGLDEVLVKATVGYVLCAAKDYALLTSLLQAGELEPGTRQVIERIVQPGDVFIDVGANIGLHSIAAARAMAGQGKIIAFEPFEQTCKLLEKNLWLNGFSAISEISRLALSDKAETRKLHLGMTSGHHSLYELENPAFYASTSVDVTTIALDDFLPENLTVKLLKLDAEGAEIDIIKGAKKLLKSNPQMFLIVELGLSHLNRNALTLEEWLEHFTGLGLVYSVINDQTGDLENWSVEQLSKATSVNLLFSSSNSQLAGGVNA